jgi:1-deoxy-D-xylulose-5-phosphate reductoisomerase
MWEASPDADDVEVGRPLPQKGPKQVKNIIILGSTGTIGKNTLEVIRRGRDRFSVLGLACKSRKDILAKQIKKFRPGYVYLEKQDVDFERRFKKVRFLYEPDGMEEMVQNEKVDIVICAIPGISTLNAVISAVKRGKTIGLATKEILVVAGHIIIPLVRKYHTCILPVDSEHNAIFQALEGVRKKDVGKLYLTASGGPFGGKPAVENVGLREVLKHPVWKMGKKITVDSATMMNKAFEIIEAHYLFGMPAEKIDVLIHPEAVIHGMVELIDGTIKSVLSLPDMKVPIKFVLDYPYRKETYWKKIDFNTKNKLTLFPADRDSVWFSLALKAIKKKGSFPVVLNAVNEEAVGLFLKGKIKFNDILNIVKNVMTAHKVKKVVSVDDIFRIHEQTKQNVRKLAGV